MSPARRISFFALVGAAALVIALTLRAQAPGVPATVADQLSTPERVQQKGWWPTKGTEPRADFVGPEKCAECHADLYASQKQHAMAQTAMRAADSEIPREHPLHTQLGPYTYEIQHSGNENLYTVSNGNDSISGPLNWAFGVGKMGQSFLFERDGSTYLVPFTYYRNPQKYDFTVDVPRDVPATLEKALGLKLGTNQVRECFGCHTTASTTSGKFDSSHLFPGVTCEACHGPGANHVAAAKAGWTEQGVSMILNPRHFSPSDSMDFCGACHRTWWDVRLADAGGLKSMRFQPYRVENSKCWGKGDPRITCIACHDPHKPLVRDDAFYDQKCLACHVSGPGAKLTADHPGAACPKATSNCVSCHMPKYKLAEVYFEFTDHQIRIVRPGEPIPE